MRLFFQQKKGNGVKCVLKKQFMDAVGIRPIVVLNVKDGIG